MTSTAPTRPARNLQVFSRIANDDNSVGLSAVAQDLLPAKPIIDLVKKIAKLTLFLPETIPLATEEDDIPRRIFELEVEDGTVASTFNRRVNILFRENVRDSDGRLKYMSETICVLTRDNGGDAGYEKKVDVSNAELCVYEVHHSYSLIGGEADLDLITPSRPMSFEFQSDIADMTVTAEFAARQKEVDHATSLLRLSLPFTHHQICNLPPASHCVTAFALGLAFFTTLSPPLSKQAPLKREKTREQPHDTGFPSKCRDSNSYLQALVFKKPQVLTRLHSRYPLCQLAAHSASTLSASSRSQI
ncbi:hypothetical protein B0H14DRAFT_3142917 [Mycena olivaceomarginata]|nr:hypothetical protein B0H14DRAFT_3142917 [Mycena olivaceomarginata]